MCLNVIIISHDLTNQVFFSGSDVWLSYWTSQNVQTKETKETVLGVQGPPTIVASNISTFDANTEESLEANLFNLGIYGGLVAGLCVLSIIRTISLFVLCMRSSVTLHDNMFKSITRAPCRFFDINPVGESPFKKAKSMKIYKIYFIRRTNPQPVLKGYWLYG